MYNVSMLKDMTYEEPAWEIATLFPPQGQWTIEDYLDLDARILSFVQTLG